MSGEKTAQAQAQAPTLQLGERVKRGDEVAIVTSLNKSGRRVGLLILTSAEEVLQNGTLNARVCIVEGEDVDRLESLG
jgi:hypothetical protein